MYYVYVAGYILLAAAMQLFTGNFPVSFLAFPLNIIFAAIWLFLLWILYKEYNNLRITRFLVYIDKLPPKRCLSVRQ